MAATASALTVNPKASIGPRRWVSGASVGTPPLASIASAISRARRIALARAPKTPSTASSLSSFKDLRVGRTAGPPRGPEHPCLLEQERQASDRECDRANELVDRDAKVPQRAEQPAEGRRQLRQGRRPTKQRGGGEHVDRQHREQREVVEAAEADFERAQVDIGCTSRDEGENHPGCEHDADPPGKPRADRPRKPRREERRQHQGAHDADGPPSRPEEQTDRQRAQRDELGSRPHAMDLAMAGHEANDVDLAEAQTASLPAAPGPPSMPRNPDARLAPDVLTWHSRRSARPRPAPPRERPGDRRATRRCRDRGRRRRWPCPRCAAKLGEDRRQPSPRLVVQSRVRLVEHQQHRVAYEQAGEGDAALLAAGQLVDTPRAHLRRDPGRPTAMAAAARSLSAP